MKKLLLLIVIIPTISFGQDTTKLTANKVYEDVKEGFYKLVNTLEGPAKHTYRVYVRQQLVTGLATGIMLLIPLLISIFLVLKSFKKGVWKDSDPVNKWAIGQIICTILMCGLLLATIFSAGDIVSKITNPEYNAIQDIVETIK